MEVNVNYAAVVLCGVLSMVVGFIWYGPFFGRKWMEIVGANPKDMAERKKMQKAAGPMYFVQFLLSLFQVYVLARYIDMLHNQLVNVNPVENALWIWAAFVMPVVAGNAMWNNDSSKISWARFLIQAGYQLTLFVMFAVILSAWR